MNKNLAKNKKTKKYRAGSKKAALTNSTIHFALDNWCKGSFYRKDIEKAYGNISDWDVSKVTKMKGLFKDKKFFNEKIENWDVSNVTDMSNMFDGAFDFNQPLEKWDVSNVKDMSYMFSYAQKFNQPLNKWNISNVENMRNMFFYTKAFNQPLNKWDVSKVKNKYRIFNREKLPKDLRTLNEKLMAKEVVEKKNIGENAITDKVSSYLGGKRKTKKRHLKNKQKKTRKSKK